MPRAERASNRTHLQAQGHRPAQAKAFHHLLRPEQHKRIRQGKQQHVQADEAQPPGPFTFILKADSRLPKIFRNRKEVGIRVPDNPIIHEICRALDAPILTTTLPLEEGEDTEYVTDPELIDEKFGDKVDLVIDGGIGGLEPSTVINCCEDIPEITRQGKGELIE